MSFLKYIMVAWVPSVALKLYSKYTCIIRYFVKLFYNGFKVTTLNKQNGVKINKVCERGYCERKEMGEIYFCIKQFVEKVVHYVGRFNKLNTSSQFLSPDRMMSTKLESFYQLAIEI